MPNQYVNKVVQSNGTTLIDISDTTAVASDVAQGKYFYLATGEKIEGTSSGGGTAAISVVDTTDSHGGTVREITALDISDTTAVASDVAQGKYFYTAAGVKTAGTASGGGGSTLVQKSITLNGTYDPDDDNADGYSGVTVNVANGASMTEVANAYGTELVITSAPGSAPSATRHTLYFEYEDESTETVYAYYDDALIGTAITATTPTTHNNKTVTSAQLDGVEWYSYTPTPTPSETWETVWQGQANTIAEDPYPYFWVSDMGDIAITENSVWRITINNDTYRSTAVNSGGSYGIVVGNQKYIGGSDDGTNVPYCWYNVGWGAWISTVDLSPSTTYSLKFERLVTS